MNLISEDFKKISNDKENINILGIETSCDETAAAIVSNGRNLISSVVASQVDEHKLYGGVVPEIASRCHCESISYVVQQALLKKNMAFDDIDAIAVSCAPGLIGALLVGINYAKGLSLAQNIPLIPVHHIKAHICSNYLVHKELHPPFLSLVVSGGNTTIIKADSFTRYKTIGSTKDDAVGEAFDKVARILGFEYPGGKVIDEISKLGDENAIKLPKPMFDNFDFSFSGIKTAVLNEYNKKKMKGEKIVKEDFAASFQKTVSDILVSVTKRAIMSENMNKLVLAGGVSANSKIRKDFERLSEQEGISLFYPPLNLCGDNAAMVATLGYYEYKKGNIAPLDLDANATLKVDY